MRAPKGHRKVLGLTEASFMPYGPTFARSKKLRGRFKAGKDYETQAFEELARRYPNEFQIAPWIKFVDSRGERWCEPDGLLHFRDTVVIVEVKIKHSARAWFQLFEVYLPLIKFLHPDKRVTCVEFTQWCDPATPYPGQYHLCPNLKVTQDPPYTNIHIWRP